MKLYIILILISLFILSGCTGKKDEALTSKMPISVQAESSTEVVDVDLSALSSTMVYAEVSQMMWEPEKYIGKTIKMRGQYTVYQDENTQKYYHAVIIADATACCAQGLEFIWLGEHIYPDEYPKENDVVEVVGIFKTYSEDDQDFYYIETKDIKII